MRTLLVSILALALAGLACDARHAPQQVQQQVAYRWQLPDGFPVPFVPADNPMSDAKVALGRRLFHDRRLSFNETQACATCHQPALAFTDGRPRAVGSTGEVHLRGPLSLANAAYRATYNWENTLLRTLEQQALVPLFNMDPAVELAMDGHEDVLLARLAADPVYPGMFRAAYPEQAAPITLDDAVKAIAAFVRTIVSGDSPYDRFVRGDAGALSAAARRGLALFEGKAGCVACHGGITFTDAEWLGTGARPVDVPMHVEGLYNVDGAGGYPFADQGLATQTGRAEDAGRFRAPTLRNVAVTAPYMHDGSLATLAEVIDHYADPFALDASGNRVAPNPRRDAAARDIDLTAGERADLLAFLEALTDEAFLADPRYADPFAAATTASAGSSP
jgi:cytochrome c peroxidase